MVSPKARIDKDYQNDLNEWYRAYKTNLKCAICRESRPEALEHHHLNPDEKEFNVYVGVKNGFSFRKLKKEIEKCAILCATHHKLIHSGSLDLKERTKWNKYLLKRKEKVKNGENVNVKTDFKAEKKERLKKETKKLGKRRKYNF